MDKIDALVCSRRRYAFFFWKSNRFNHFKELYVNDNDHFYVDWGSRSGCSVAGRQCRSAGPRPRLQHCGPPQATLRLTVRHEAEEDQVLRKSTKVQKSSRCGITILPWRRVTAVGYEDMLVMVRNNLQCKSLSFSPPLFLSFSLSLPLSLCVSLSLSLSLSLIQ